MFRVLCLAAALLVLAVPARAQTPPEQNVHARLIAEHETVAPGQTVTIALEEMINKDWHTYWVNPGDAGAPTEIHWTLPRGWQAGDIQWPTPHPIPVAGLMDYGYEDKVWLLSDLIVPENTRPGTIVTLRANANWLVCKDICIPEETSLLLQLLVSADPEPVAPARAAEFADARSKLPVPSPWQVSYAAGNTLDLFVAAPELAAAKPTKVEFFPLQPGTIRGAAPQLLGFADGGLVLRLEPGKRLASLTDPLEGLLVLTSADSSVQAVQFSALPGAVPEAGYQSQVPQLELYVALLFAFLGGLILNVMPCVLPILALKALAFARGNSSGARIQGISYAVGALASFAALGLVIVLLLQSGAILGWGFQLQEPVVVAAFALLMFAIGLSLAGLYSIAPITAGGKLAGKDGTAGAFFTGVLAVAVAAPCTAPFMAGALGFALTQTTPVALAVFLSLGLGFAFPILLLSLWPAAVRALPRPGPWMLKLKHLFAIPMFGAAAWLAWVLAQQTGTNGLILLAAAALATTIGLSVWRYSQSGKLGGRRVGAVILVLAIVASLGTLYLLHGQAQAPVVAERADAYTPQRLAELRAEQRPVFVNATAAWCITCLVNEQVVLSRSSVQQIFKDNDVVALVADWTNRDSAITQLLREQGRSGVPLYLYYAPGSVAPVILPQILSEEAIRSAIEN